MGDGGCGGDAGVGVDYCGEWARGVRVGEALIGAAGAWKLDVLKELKVCGYKSLKCRGNVPAAKEVWLTQ